MTYVSKVTTYYFIDKGLYITENHATWPFYFCLAVFLWLAIASSFSFINWIIALVLGVVAAIFIGLAINSLKPIDAIIHKKTMIPWTSVEKAEMKDRHVKIFLKNDPNKKADLVHDKRPLLIEFDVAKDQIVEKEQVLSSRLGNKFVIII
jgi:hypothetical protein